MREYYLDADKVPRENRYRKTKRFLDEQNNIEYQELPSEIFIPNSPNDIYHVVVSGEEARLDLISDKYYGTPFYWWVIACASNISDPITDVVVNRKLRVPPLNIVLQLDY